MMQSVLVFISLILSSNSFAQFLTVEAPQYFLCELEEEGLQAEIKLELQPQFMTVKISKGDVVLRKVSGVALLTEDDFSSINPKFGPVKKIQLGAYTLTKEKGYLFTYPSFGGEWAGQNVSVACTVKE